MISGTVLLHLEQPDWKGALAYFVLRAAHYAEEYHGIRKMILDCEEIPAEVRDLWRASLDLRKRKIDICCSPAPHAPIRAFCAPDFVMAADGKELSLGIPEIPHLTDFHIHTKIAYCSENMDVAKALEMEHLSGVSHVNFAEHSGQLFSSVRDYWGNRFCWRERKKCYDRTGQYEELIRISPAALYGLELDVDEDDTVEDFRSPLLNGYRLGAIHFLGTDLSFEEKKADYMRRLDALLAAGIDILAHPFRVFLKGNSPVPEDLFEPVADRLIATGVAAEINFHTNHPQPEFVNLLLKKGGKISFGTDAHNLYEAGFLRPHYDFCRGIGIAGKLDEVLIFHKEGRNHNDSAGK